MELPNTINSQAASTRAVLTACDMGYMPGAVAMLRSVARHHPEVDRYCLVPAEVVKPATEALNGLATVITAPRRVAGVTDRYQVAYGRLFMPIALARYETAVWVDGDALFCRPAPELWDIKPGRVNVAVCWPSNRVPNNLPPELRGRFSELYPDLAATPGFNSGVFGLRPVDWPDFPERIEAVITRLGCENHPAFFDQPLINVVFETAADYRDKVFNWTEMFDDPAPPGRVRIVHFASRPKPWEPGYPRHEPGYWFWLRHGLGETNPSRLAVAKARIWLNTPRRKLSRLLGR